MSKKIGLMISKEGGYKLLEYFVNKKNYRNLFIITIDDKNDSRSVKDKIISFAEENKIPFFITKNKKETIDIINKEAPSLVLVHGWYTIIPVNNLKNIKFLGFHYSLLPAYRGNAPLVWSIINGDKKTGITLFEFNNEMDAGDIIYQAEIEIKEDDYISDILRRIEKKLFEILNENFETIVSGKITGKSQTKTGISYCAKRIPADGKINWHLSATKIYNFIRAQAPPYPGAFTLLNGEKIIITKAEKMEVKYYGTPGQIAQKIGKNVIVICGENSAILIKKVIKKGKEFSASEIFDSINIRL